MTTVIVRNQAQYVIGATPTFTIKGKKTKTPSWCGPNTLAIVRDEDGGLSLINHRHIVKIDGKKFEQEEPKVKTYTVAGSKGNVYTVTDNGGRLTCSCTGFQFRKSCKHLGMI